MVKLIISGIVIFDECEVSLTSNSLDTKVTVKFQDTNHSFKQTIFRLDSIKSRDPNPISIVSESDVIEAIGYFVKYEYNKQYHNYYIEIELAIVNNFNRKTVTKEETDMKSKHVSALLMEGCKTIGAIFEDFGKVYTYKTLLDLEVGDKVLVEARGELKVVEVAEVHEIPNIDINSSIDYKWVVQKVDTSHVEEIKAKESEFQRHLKELEQKAVVQSAKSLLADKLGLDVDSLNDSIKLLNGK